MVQWAPAISQKSPKGVDGVNRFTRASTLLKVGVFEQVNAMVKLYVNGLDLS